MLSGCHLDMWNQPKYETFETSTFYPDLASARPAIPGTVSYAGARRDWEHPIFSAITEEAKIPAATDDAFYTGRLDGRFIDQNYFLDAAYGGAAEGETFQELLERGRERFNITCMPCHGLTGEGNGIVVQRGFPKPPSYHIDRLREVEDGYIFDVITNGFGRMYNYAARVKPEDRWAIIAYIRALQFSQNVDLDSLPAQTRSALETAMREYEAASQEHAAGHEAAENGHH
ncbi:MAG: cytochrome c [Candidatus Hydrogenedentes bacterium]|nr:cytochrome c [Candidatus Hydrogenedentota bacterium]